MYRRATLLVFTALIIASTTLSLSPIFENTALAADPTTCEQYANSSNGEKALIKKACDKGFDIKKSGTGSCALSYPIGAGQSADVKFACDFGHDTATAKDGAGTTDGGGNTPGAEDKPSCAIDGIGWFICPVMTFMATVNDLSYDFLSSYFLTINPQVISSKDTESAWRNFRDIANVAFVIAILVVIYSQISSVGLNNYGIKRMLPKIIISAILVNISFFICQLAVDLSNLLGFGITALFNSIQIGTAGPVDGGVLTKIGVGLTWTAIIGSIIAGAVGIALAISIPVVLASILAIGLVVLMLVARQAIVVLLIVVSPLAFVAYLLPNTEQWFKKWYQMFFAMLILFPVVGAVFGASFLAAKIVDASADGQLMMRLVALAISAIPLFVVPGLLRGSLNAAGTIGTKLQNMSGKAASNIGARAKDSSRIGTGLADMKRYTATKRNIKFAKGRGSGVMKPIGTVRAGKGYNEEARLSALSLADEEYEKKVRGANQILTTTKTYDEKLGIAEGKLDASEYEREAAVRFVMQAGNLNERRQVMSSMGTMTDSQLRSAIGGMRSAKDTAVYGSSTLGILESMSANQRQNMTAEMVDATLSAGAMQKVVDGSMDASTFTRDEHTAKYLSSEINGTDLNGNAVAGKPALSTEQRSKFASDLSSHINSEAGSSINSAVRSKAQSVGATVSSDQPTTQNVAQPTQPIQPAGGAQPRPQANPFTQRTSEPAGSSNFTQSSDGSLYVPRNPK